MLLVVHECIWGLRFRIRTIDVQFQLRNWNRNPTLSEKIAQSTVYLHLRQLCAFLHSGPTGFIRLSSQEQIAYFLTQEAVYFLVHFKFPRVLN